MEPSPSGLPDYCQSLIKRVVEETGCPFHVVEKPFVEFDSVLNMATPARRTHQLQYRSEYKSHREHFIVNNCHKVLRFWQAPLEDKYLPAIEQGRKLPKAEHNELLRKVPRAVRSEAHDISRLLFTGVVRQLISFPVDLHVESEVAKELPQHKAKQLSYLSRQVHDFLPTLNEQMLAHFPNHVYRSTTAMNIAYAEEAGRLAGVVPSPVFRKHSSRVLAEDLLHELYQITTPGIVGDRMLTDAWAHELGLHGWYEWVRAGEV